MSYEKIELVGGEVIYLEVASSPEGSVQAGLRDNGKKAGIDLKSEASKVGIFLKELRKGVLDTLNEISPNQMELEVGCEFCQEFGCVVLKSAINAQVKVKMTWDFTK